jgi:hypothetical protein
MSPSATPTHKTAFKVRAFDVNRWLLWAKQDSTWAWQLTPTDPNSTRLVTQIQVVYNWRRPLSAVLGVVLMEFGNFPMLGKMLQGIKARAESLAQEASQRADGASSTH